METRNNILLAVCATFSILNLVESQNYQQVIYPKDVRDRIWFPYFEPEWTQINTTLKVSDSSDGYDPPLDAFKTAAIPTNASEKMTITWSLDISDDQTYCYIYVADIQQIKMMKKGRAKATVRFTLDDPSMTLSIGFLFDVFKNIFFYSLEGNKKLCVACGTKFPVVLVVASVSSAVIIIIGLVLIVLVRRRKQSAGKGTYKRKI
ncbi:hypothetical protein ARALYDRAFT_894187 [Arabidopsis lyrata subsp. lyrata]|uniref:Malectin-like domain-containing protein n=1 Tax=Arabidopsis lyrata subsp. lyrata TaxID=81972 RepID=D7KSZ2_ARALL|nr:hypothetical protein ARALYDRAFT_894187 [Arabidopsis lyrata subsp. lyrata]